MDSVEHGLAELALTEIAIAHAWCRENMATVEYRLQGERYSVRVRVAGYPPTERPHFIDAVREHRTMVEQRRLESNLADT